MAKAIKEGPATITISAAGGSVGVGATVQAELGGGEAAGVVQASAGVSLTLSPAGAANLAINALEAAFPAASGLLEMVRAGVQAELARLTV